MNKNEPMVDHIVTKYRGEPEDTLDAQGLGTRGAAGPNDHVVAAVSDDLRASSAKTNELILRSTASVCLTRSLVAVARKALARSRGLLGGRDDRD
jgi:hypothetical protein